MLGRDLIDIHAHFFTDDYRAAMRSAGLRNVDGFPIPDWSVESALDLMGQWGIKTAMLSISAPGIEFVPATSARASRGRSMNSTRSLFSSVLINSEGLPYCRFLTSMVPCLKLHTRSTF